MHEEAYRWAIRLCPRKSVHISQGSQGLVKRLWVERRYRDPWYTQRSDQRNLTEWWPIGSIRNHHFGISQSNWEVIHQKANSRSTRHVQSLPLPYKLNVRHRKVESANLVEGVHGWRIRIWSPPPQDTDSRIIPRYQCNYGIDQGQIIIP